jgi:hypothetical protein
MGRSRHCMRGVMAGVRGNERCQALFHTAPTPAGACKSFFEESWLKSARRVMAQVIHTETVRIGQAEKTTTEGRIKWTLYYYRITIHMNSYNHRNSS